MLAVMQKFDAPNGLIENRWTEMSVGVGSVVETLLAENQTEDIYEEIDHTFIVEADGDELSIIRAEFDIVVGHSYPKIRFVGDQARFIVANLVL